jgi:hypothetical protein
MVLTELDRLTPHQHVVLASATSNVLIDLGHREKFSLSELDQMRLEEGGSAFFTRDIPVETIKVCAEAFQQLLDGKFDGRCEDGTKVPLPPPVVPPPNRSWWRRFLDPVSRWLNS